MTKVIDDRLCVVAACAENHNLFGLLLRAPLSDLKQISGFMGTNSRLRDPKMIEALESAIASRLRPIVRSQNLATVVKPQLDLDKAIKQARRQIETDLAEIIASMNPYTFEWLVSALLISLGYSDVVVTKKSNDGGVDLRGTLIVGGVAATKFAIQVKRTASVGRPVVQNIRGSLSAHEAGMVITSGQFSEGARVEAEDPTKARIPLIDGRRLVELLIDHGIGAREVIYRVFSLDLKTLSDSHLIALAKQESSEFEES